MGKKHRKTLWCSAASIARAADHAVRECGRPVDREGAPNFSCLLLERTRWAHDILRITPQNEMEQCETG